MIPQYRTLKLKLPKYRNTVNPHVPLLLESTGLLRLKNDSLINFLLTKSIQHEGKGFENSQNDQQRECFDVLSNSLN